jgi:gluconokinase
MIVVIMGVSGVGKTTVGELLAASLDWPFYDADDFHPVANVEKMRRGEPLTDADRGPWLDAVAGLIHSSADGGRSAVVACSALRAAYRATLTAAANDVRIVFLNAPREVLAERIGRRTGHFMPASQLPNQFTTLEPPKDAIWIDACQAPSDIVTSIRTALGIEPSH